MTSSIPKKILDNVILILVIVCFLVAVLLVIKFAGIQLDWSKIPLGLYSKYIAVIVDIANTSCLLGILIGVPYGIGATRKNLVIRKLSSWYLNLLQGVPLIIIIFMVYGVLSLSLKLSNYVCGVIALSIFASFRTGILIENTTNWFNKKYGNNLKADKGVYKVGFVHHLKVLICVILNVYTQMIKESSLLSLIAVPELFFFTRKVISQTMDHAVIIPMVIIYLMLTLSLTIIFRVVRRLLIKDKTFFADPNNTYLWS